MNRRPYLTHKQRPLSAIFIGSPDSNSAPATPELPVLPSSPSTSSNGSGLPSPPATNSTGSGEGSTNGGSLRKKTARSEAGSDMLNGSFNKSQTSFKSRATNFSDGEDDHHDHENDDDTTARFDLERRRSSLTSATQENMSALQRVRSLTQRNRMVLDKLSSISRLSSPAPPKSSRSPFSPPATQDPSPTSSSNTSSSRLSASSRPRTSLSNVSNTQFSGGNSSSLRQAPPDYSGSETEREPEPHREYGHHYSSSDSMSATPTTAYSEARSIVGDTPSQSRFIRRRLSAPATPDKTLNTSTVTRGRVEESSRARERSRGPGRERDRSTGPNMAPSRGPSPGPSRTPRKRASVMSVRVNRYDDDEEADRDDITSAALAAVASSRRSPPGSRRNRGTLPREFKETDRRTMDVKEPTTPSRNRERERAQRRSPSPRSPRASTSNSNNPSPRKYGRPSTIRELTRKHQTRWLSEDLSAQDRDDITSSVGRRQSQKPGSSESPITQGGRSLVGEGLRAAGLTRRRDTSEDPFAGNGDAPVIPRRTRSSGSSAIANGEPRYSSPAGLSYSSRASERALEPRTPAQRHERTATYTGGTRPGTSMAALHSDEPRTAPPGARTYRSSYAMEREPSSSSSQQASEGFSAFDRTSVNRGNHTAPLPASAMGASSARDPHAEHRRLLLDALSMFDTQLSRLPPMGQTTTTTIPDVFQTSQHLVHTIDKLNSVLKTGTNQALEAQIEAEVSDMHEQLPAEIWAKVGMDYREHLRLSDEVVRTMTAFLLGVSRVLRDGNSTAGNHQQHLRTMSLDEDAVSKQRSADGMSAGSLSIDRRSSDGRRSRETRRSWDPRESSNTTLNLSRLTSRERSNGTLSRPGSSLNHIRGSAASNSEAKSNSDGSPREQTHQGIRTLPSALLNPANRPFTTPRDQRVTSDPSSRHTPSFDSPDSYEPSPTPAPRSTSAFQRSRALPPIAIPPSLSTLPSESLLRRSATSTTSTSTDKSSTRRKISSNSNITIKAESSTSSSFQPIIKPSNTTTAVTPHTVSHSPEVSTSSLPGNSSSSSFTHTNGVVFSRPSTISVSTLNGIQQRERTISNSSVDEPISAVSAFSSLRSPMSGSETERPRTLGLRNRMSLDRGATPERGTIGSSASTLLSSRRERRRTITEIFQN
ncbi:hypothetical protein QCA50_006789 [Cerrena zonata]|uniref:Uncharacterized protein n=1 Tax=Cerrena zonata TaxID=2478898 RepID=A0AAW0GG24_9APHY